MKYCLSLSPHVDPLKLCKLLLTLADLKFPCCVPLVNTALALLFLLNEHWSQVSLNCTFLCHLNLNPGITDTFKLSFFHSTTSMQGRPWIRILELLFNSLHFYSLKVYKTILTIRFTQISEHSGKQVAWNKRGIYQSLNSDFFFFHEELVKNH